MPLKYPKTERKDYFDDYHGNKIQDPYHYMEDPENDLTKQFVSGNNKIVDKFINEDDLAYFKDKLLETMTYTRYTVPIKKGNRYFYTKFDGRIAQPIIYMREGLKGEEIAVFNPNHLSEDGTTASIMRSYSPNGKYLATTISVHGSDWQQIYLIDLNTGEIKDKLTWVTITQMRWKKDNSGFYYTKFPDQTNLATEDRRKYAKIYFHKVGTSQDKDILIYDPKNKNRGPYTNISSDGKYLFVGVSETTLPENMLIFRKEDSTDDFTSIVPDLDGNEYLVIDSIEDILYIRTSYGAPKNRIMALDLKTVGKENWKEIIPEQESVLTQNHIINNKLVLVYEEDVKHVVKIYSLEGKFEKEIELPSFGNITSGNRYVSSISGEQKGDEFFFGFNSFFYPQAVFRYDFKLEEVTTFFPSDLDIDPLKFKVKQVFYASKDGTQIPMYIMYKKGITLNGDNPTILYGYGGYNISTLPLYSSVIYTWIKEGGIYVKANLRGGGEYGKEWHEQALLGNKQNVFDDFIAAAEWLIENKYTNSTKLAINGRSNGGLLVGACMTQRPDLFGAAIPQVGVFDMLRYPLQKDAGHYWIREYGDAMKYEEHFKFLIDYSPYHNVKVASYPATLITAAEGDDRVAPMHSKKFGAALQYAHKGDEPILVRIETRAGHGYGKPIAKIAEDEAISLAFLKKVLRM